MCLIFPFDPIIPSIFKNVFYRKKIGRKFEEVICPTEPLLDLNMLNVPQTVTISWTSDGMDDLETDLAFTYKPDPVIEEIHPNITIVR